MIPLTLPRRLLDTRGAYEEAYRVNKKRGSNLDRLDPLPDYLLPSLLLLFIYKRIACLNTNIGLIGKESIYARGQECLDFAIRIPQLVGRAGGALEIRG